MIFDESVQIYFSILWLTYRTAMFELFHSVRYLGGSDAGPTIRYLRFTTQEGYAVDAC